MWRWFIPKNNWQEICINQDRLSSDRLVWSIFDIDRFSSNRLVWSFCFVDNTRSLQAGYFEFLTTAGLLQTYWFEVIWTIRCFLQKKDWFYNMTVYGPKSQKKHRFQKTMKQTEQWTFLRRIKTRKIHKKFQFLNSEWSLIARPIWRCFVRYYAGLKIIKIRQKHQFEGSEWSK